MKNKKLIYISLFILIFGILFFFLFVQKTETSKIRDDFNGKVAEFNVTVYNWGFDPKVIEVEEGTLVKLNLNTVEGNHGISIYDFDINQYLKKGSVVNIEFIADKKGVFEFFCNVYCGEGHGNMIGKLIIK